MQRIPSADVAPAEVGGQHVHVIGLFHHAVVDTDVAAARVGFANEGFLVGCAQRGRAFVEHFGNITQAGVKSSQNHIGAPHEQAGVPQKVAAFHKHLRQLQIRLFGEGFHLVQLAAGQALVVHVLNVAVAGIGPRGLNAERDKHIVGPRRVDSGADEAAKLVFA